MKIRGGWRLFIRNRRRTWQEAVRMWWGGGRNNFWSRGHKAKRYWIPQMSQGQEQGLSFFLMRWEFCGVFVILENFLQILKQSVKCSLQQQIKILFYSLGAESCERRIIMSLTMTENYLFSYCFIYLCKAIRSEKLLRYVSPHCEPGSQFNK